MKINRTPLAETPKSDVHITDGWSGETHIFASQVSVSDYPTHSPVLGPDGCPLEYAARTTVGFNLKLEGAS